MVATDSEGEQQAKDETLEGSLGRQSSIYSLTLDEFQHTLCEAGKNFGSMNMDEFLNSIWTAEENQANAAHGGQAAAATSTSNGAPHFSLQFENNNGSSSSSRIAKQRSLPRQGSLTLPEPLCGKTVEEVWSEIHKNHHQQQQSNGGNNSHVQNNNPQKQATFGEMTLEDFLIRAGVVREQNFAIPAASAPAPPQQAAFNVYQNGVGPSYMARPVMGAVNSVSAYQTMQGGVGEVVGYPGGMKRGVGGGYPQPPPAVGYGGRLGNGNGGGFGQVMGSPVSPVSSDGLGAGQVESGGQYATRGGRKRMADAPVEKVVERRQRRMIKNRESAARSRARKQAYTVELEAELNQLKEENAHLKQELAELERERKLQYYEEERAKGQMQTKAHKENEMPQTVRRTLSCTY